MRFLKTYSLLVLIGFFLQCSGRKEIHDPKEYIQWINNPENGLTIVKKINNLKITVKYLPPEYLAYQELKEKKQLSQQVKDSLVNHYARNKTFLLTVGPEDGNNKAGADIMFRGIQKYEEYRLRSVTMNFEMAEFVSLVTSKGSLAPVLSTMENVYGLKPDRSIYFVFAQQQPGHNLNEEEVLDFTFNDELFGTGINHFGFTREKLEKTPRFVF